MANNIQTNFTAGELSPDIFGRVDLNKYQSGAETIKNWLVHVHGGVSTRPGFRYLGTALGTGRLIPFVFNTEQSYILEFTNLKMRIIKDDGFVVTPPGTTITEIVSPYTAADLALVKYHQISDTMYMTHPSYPIQKLTRTDHHVWTFTVVTTTSSVAAPAGLAGVNSIAVGSVTRDMKYKVAAVIDGEESLSSAAVTVTVDSPWTSGAVVTLSWTAVAGADSYVVYKNSRGFWGFMGSTEDNGFIDDNINENITRGPMSDNTPFSGANLYPASVGLFEQRIFYSGSNNFPQTVYGSQPSLLDNFAKSSITLDTNSLEFTLFTEKAERVRHIVEMDTLVLLTSESERLLDHGANTDALTPTSVKNRRRSGFGSSDVKPVKVGSELMFIQRGGNVARNFFYSLQADGYDSSDLTLLARQLFRGYTITDWAYQQDPEKIIWVVRSDGALLGLTYDKKQEVWGWHQHETQGEVVSIAVLNGDAEDGIYMIIKREVGGSDVYYVEKMSNGDRTDVTTSFCVDSGLSYDGVAVKTFTGLDHLIGETVAILADGNVMPTQVVDATGSVTISIAAEKVHIGLPFTADLFTLRMAIPSGSGTIQALRKVIDVLWLRVENTLGLKVGPDIDRLTIVKSRTNENYDMATGLHTGDIQINNNDSLNREGQVLVRVDTPLPATLRAIIYEVDIND